MNQPAASPPPATSQSPVRTSSRPQPNFDPTRSQSAASPRSASSAVSVSAGQDVPDIPVDTGPRRVRLVLSRVDPWSVMKLSFLLSIALGIGIVVATWVLWQVLNNMGVFASIIGIVDEVGAMNQFGPLLEYLELSRVLSAATVFAVADIVLVTAIATLGAFVYNLVAAMVGGLHVTFTDE